MEIQQKLFKSPENDGNDENDENDDNNGSSGQGGGNPTQGDGTGGVIKPGEEGGGPDTTK